LASIYFPRRIENMTNKGSVAALVSTVAGVGLLILLAFALLSPAGGRPALGDPAPDFSIDLFDGTEVSLSNWRGQVVVLNFWASWCAPCRQEAPDLQEIWERYQDKGVVVLGVSYKDAEDASRSFTEEFGLTYRNGADLRNKISRAYGVTGVPETFFIDADGKVAWFHLGQVTADLLTSELAQLVER
jgi:cytochrome c biogenesis protein CcmG/thiol:disulfide interchange protein DsbE